MMGSMKTPKPTWPSKVKNYDGFRENTKTYMTNQGQKSWWNPRKHQNPHDIHTNQIMMVSTKTPKPTWLTRVKSHDGIRENAKTYMTFIPIKSWWYPEKRQNLHDKPNQKRWWKPRKYQKIMIFIVIYRKLMHLYNTTVNLSCMKRNHQNLH